MKKAERIFLIVSVSLYALAGLFDLMNWAGGSVMMSIGVLIYLVGFLPFYYISQKRNPAEGLQKASQIVGVTATSLFVIGLFFKEFHWPGASITLTLAILMFDLAYLPIQLIFNWRKCETKLQKTYAIIKFLAIMYIVSGFLFKSMHWPGSGIFLILGTIFLPLFLLFYFILRYKQQGKLPFVIDDLLLTVLGFVIYMFLTTHLVSPRVAMGYLDLEEAYITNNAGFETANQMIYSSLDSIGITDTEIRASILELQDLASGFHQTLDSMKVGFYREVYGRWFEEGDDHRYIGQEAVGTFDPGYRFFIDQGNGTLLKNSLGSYREGLLRIAADYNLQSSLLGMGLEAKSQLMRWGEEIPWERFMFDKATGNVIVNLSWLKQMALISEATLLNGLVSQIDLSSETKLLQEMTAQESHRAMKLKENEIVRFKQQQALHDARIANTEAEAKQNKLMALFGFVGIAFVLVLLIISTRAYVRKQKDNKRLAQQKDRIAEVNEELNQQNEEIAAQRDEIEAQRDEIESQRDMVVKQKGLIEKVHNEISASIDYASKLQHAILPETELLKEIFADHLVFYRPKQKVSGDFYWWSEIENQVIIAAADCTGHGVPGAFMSMLGISLLREIVNKEYITQPGVILRRLRKEVIRSLKKEILVNKKMVWT